MMKKVKNKTRMKTANRRKRWRKTGTRKKEKKSKRTKMIKAPNRTWKMTWSLARLSPKSKVREETIRPTPARRIRSQCSRARVLEMMSSGSPPRTCCGSRMIRMSKTMRRMRMRTTRSRAKKRSKRTARMKLMMRRRKKPKLSSQSQPRRNRRKRTCPGSIKLPYRKRSR